MRPLPLRMLVPPLVLAPVLAFGTVAGYIASTHVQTVFENLLEALNLAESYEGRYKLELAVPLEQFSRFGRPSRVCLWLSSTSHYCSAIFGACNNV